MFASIIRAKRGPRHMPDSSIVSRSGYAREIATTLRVQYGTTLPQDLTIGREWTRLHIVLTIEHIPGSGMNITLTGAAGSLISSPQLEQGKIPTLYQATDGVLDDTEEYGAWFCRGGVGGTIQHPLLRLNEDGSISSPTVRSSSTGRHGLFLRRAVRWDKVPSPCRR